MTVLISGVRGQKSSQSLTALSSNTVVVNKKFMYRTSSTYIVHINPSPYCRRTLCILLLLRTNKFGTLTS